MPLVIWEGLVENMTSEQKPERGEGEGVWISGGEHFASFLGKVASCAWHVHTATSLHMLFPEYLCPHCYPVTVFQAKLTDDFLGKVPYFSRASLHPFWKHKRL